ncbi:MAG: element excision factor XisH family protein, partial [Microcystis panniformis]
MNYTIAIKKQASKALANLPQDSYQKVRDGIRALADNPRPAGCLKLTGREGWRIRIGVYFRYWTSKGHLPIGDRVFNKNLEEAIAYNKSSDQNRRRQMPAKDLYHEAVKNALIKDGWTITADPYPIEYEDAELYPDLAIEKYISEEQRQRKIIIEIKSFLGPSMIKDFEMALGQYIFYRDLIQLGQDEYQEIYLAI